MRQKQAILRTLFIITCLLTSSSIKSQQDNLIKSSLSPYFSAYKNTAYTSNDKIKIDSLWLNDDQKTLSIFLNEGFSSQPFRQELVSKIYADVTALLPAPYNTYSLRIHALRYPIEDLIPQNLTGSRNRTWGDNRHKGNAWVTPLSNQFEITHGLQDCHFSIWASHGKYYSYKTATWEWQRPHLFCTTEDMFTQTIAIPYLYPMLQNAGGYVFTPRERDWQKNEVIVDNDTPHENGHYEEQEGKNPWEEAGPGWGRLHTYYQDGENPFLDGSYKFAKTVSSAKSASNILWKPQIPVEGEYAVYVSYKTLENSIDDAIYTVRHKGINTRFRVNQRMGGGTWVYLGTFRFGQGNSDDNCVFLSNHSKNNGTITADAVRFGGGMSNIMRGDTLRTHMSGSGLPRYLEGARYSAMWYGIPEEVYSQFEGIDDYSDDIRCRSLVTNYMARGSQYLPGDSGLCVPIDLSLAIHSDAGFQKDLSHIGTLGIYTTDINEGLTGNGISRLASRDLCDIIMTQITRDISTYFGIWNRRQMHDKNYGESRDPGVPAMILETLSHQNYFDLLRGHDPYFKFMLARAIYKGILHYEAYMHDFVPVTQPLPIRDLAVDVSPNGVATLTWNPVLDPTDESATPENYVLYTKMGNQDYDNGTLIHGATSYEFDLQPGTLYQFRVAAVNAGGMSMLSPEVCCNYGGPEAPRILLVDGFDRVAGPQAIHNATQQGFDFSIDPGVADVKTAGYCGYQRNFNLNRIGRDMGASGDEMTGLVVRGNTHDYTTMHAQDYLAAGSAYTIASCTRDALQYVYLKSYRMMDLILGAQRVDGYSGREYKTFTPLLKDLILQYLSTSGSLLVSGAYVGSDMLSAEDKQFTANVLKYQFHSQEATENLSDIRGMNTQLSLYNSPSEVSYWVTHTDVIVPTANAFSTMSYQQTGMSASIAYQGTDYRLMVFGFPLECIQQADVRRNILQASLQFLLTNN